MTEPSQPPPALDSMAPPAVDRRLRRSRKDRILAGVCGGLGRYLNVDPVVLRIVAVALFFAGIGVIAYLVAWVVIPEASAEEDEEPGPVEARRQTAVVLGAGLVVMGVVLALRAAVPGFGHMMFWPVVVVAAGVLLVAAARR